MKILRGAMPRWFCLVHREFKAVHITNVADLRINLKTQLEALNAIKLSDNEFSQIRNSLAKGNAFDKAKTLRDRLSINRDDGTNCHIRFLDSKWSKNSFQVTQQVTVEGSYRNRYDVTILINGLPLIQVELKRRGLELKEAFNQINRYLSRHSYWAEDGLFHCHPMKADPFFNCDANSVAFLSPTHTPSDSYYSVT
ncbi:MAG: hypothetical protein B6I36_06135, partial [Desulfobacteraceae bacterium 4572_35.1]